MTPTERIQIVNELRRAFPSHRRLHEALADYEALAIEANRAKPVAKPKASNSRAVYMREHRARERELIREARRQKEAK